MADKPKSELDEAIELALQNPDKIRMNHVVWAAQRAVFGKDCKVVFRRHLTLEILKVRVERLQDISEEDAIAEGITYPCDTAKAAYAQLWDSLHGKGEWDKNPFVWVIEFQKV